MGTAAGIRAGRAYVELGVDGGPLARGLRSASKSLTAFGASMRTIGIGITAAAGSVITPLAAAVKMFAAAGDELDEASARTGIGVEALSELKFAAELAGSGLGDLEAASKKMSRTIVEAAGGSTAAADALSTLGLSAAELLALSPEEQFTRIGAALAAIENPTRRAAAALEVFGKSGTKLLPVVESLAAARAEARRLGITMSTDAAQKAAALSDALDTLWRVAKRLGESFGEALADDVTTIVKGITALAAGAIRFVSANQGLLTAVAAGATSLLGLGTALIGTGLAVSIIGVGLGGLATLAAGAAVVLNTLVGAAAALFTPLGLVAAAVAGVGTALAIHTVAGAAAIDWLGGKFRALADIAGAAWKGIGDALATGDIAQAAKILWAGIELAWVEGTQEIRLVWINAKAFLIDGFNMLVAEFHAAVQKIVSLLKISLVEGAAFVKKAHIEIAAWLNGLWLDAVSGFVSLWESAINSVTNMLIDWRGLFDKRVDTDAAKAMSDDKSRVQQEAIARSHLDRLAAVEKERDASLAAAKAVDDARRAAVGAEANERLATIQAALDADMVGTEQMRHEAINAARERKRALEDELKTLTDKAALARENAEVLAAAKGKPAAAAAQAAAAAEVGIETRRGSAGGTFSARAAELIGRGASRTQERMVKAAERTAKAAEAIERKVGDLDVEYGA